MLNENQNTTIADSTYQIITVEPELSTMPLHNAVLKLAMPAVMSMLFIMVFNLVDVWWVSKLGAEPLAGVSASLFFLWALESVETLVSTGVNAMVARFVGARDLAKASVVAGQGILLSLLLSLGFGVLAYFTAESIFAAMGLQGQAFDAAVAYLRTIAAGLIFIFGTWSVDAIFRGMGDTKTPMKIIGLALALNAVLDPIFIFGMGPFPRMGAAGAALATVLTRALAVVWGIYLLRNRQVRVKIDWSFKYLLNRDIMWRISKIGAPIAFSGVMFSLSYMFLTSVITKYGSSALAALGLGHRIEGLAFFMSAGFSIAAATLVGQNLGAQKPDRAEKAAWLCVLDISILLGSVCLMYFVFAEQIMRFFIDDPVVIQEGVRYLKIIAFFEIFLGFEVVLEGAFGGSGHSLPPMLVSVPLTWARIPLAILLADTLNMGTSGIWWAIALTTGAKGIVLGIWFKGNRWKRKQL